MKNNKDYFIAIFYLGSHAATLSESKATNLPQDIRTKDF